MSTRLSLSPELLESRDMMAVDVLASIVVEGDARFIPRSLAEFNGSVYMRLSDNITGPEPWVTEGTAESTRLLKDIRVGNFGSGARDFTPFDGRLFFTASNGFSGLELWLTDGTKGTTQLVADIWPGSENGAPTEFTVFQDHLYFFANDGETGRELYRSDGTNLGTLSLGDLVPGIAGVSGENLMVIGDQMFFRSDSTSSEAQGIWVSDGTAAGTSRVPFTGLDLADIDLMTAHSGELVFSSAGKVWATDGTAAGSREITPTGDPLGDSISSLVSVGDRLFVSDDQGLHEITNSLTTSRTISPFADGAASSSGKLYFWNSFGFFVVQDGEGALLHPFNPQFGTQVGTTDSVPGGILFNINRALDRWEIWVSDGTVTGTQLLERVTTNSSEPFVEFQQVGGRIYFTATNGNFHESVWTIPAPELAATPAVPGDLNADATVNALDIDLLHEMLATGANDTSADLNGDGNVSTDDLEILITDILNSRRGDLNLDGQVDFADFLQLSNAFGKTEAGWSDGDLDGDGQVGFADFLSLSVNFGFEADE